MVKQLQKGAYVIKRCVLANRLTASYHINTGCKHLKNNHGGNQHAGCNCGNCHMTITPTGDVFACRRVTDSKVGNAFTDRLADLWVCELEMYRQYEKHEKCSKCELGAWCRGCPAVANGTNGSFYAADPQCWKEIKERNHEAN